MMNMLRRVKALEFIVALGILVALHLLFGPELEKADPSKNGLFIFEKVLIVLVFVSYVAQEIKTWHAKETKGWFQRLGEFGIVLICILCSGGMYVILVKVVGMTM